MSHVVRNMNAVCAPQASKINPIIPTGLYSQSPLHNDELQLSVRWARDLDELESLVDKWNVLADQALWHNPAFEPNYLIPALKHLGDSAIRVLLVEGGHQNGSKELLGLLPLRSVRPFGLPLSGLEIWKHEHCFDTTPLLSRNIASLVWTEICRFLVGQKIGLLLLDTVSAEPEFEQVLEAANSQLGQTAFEKRRFQRAALVPAETHQTYTNEFISKKLRKNLGRLSRRLAELGEVTVSVSDSSSHYRKLGEEFMRIEASGWKGKDGTAISSKPATQSFYRELIRRSSADGKARFVTLSLDQKPIAMLSDIRSGNFIYSYKTAFDEDFSQYSPGLQVELRNIDLLHREGICLADSCTSSDNTAINRIWGQKLEFQTTVLALRPGIPRLLTKSLPILQSIVRKFKRR